MHPAVRFVLLGFCGWLPSMLPGQAFVSTTDAVTRLQGKTLFLRGMWHGDKLAFDSGGKLLGKAAIQSFTLSSVLIDTVRQNKGKLEIDGHRYGLEFTDDVPVRVALSASPGSTEVEHLVLTIVPPADGNYAPALDAIFVDDLEHLAPLLPEMWKDVAAHDFDLSGKVDSRPVSVPSAGKGIAFPRLLQQRDPEFSTAARNLRHTGTVVVGLIVDVQGNPTHLRIQRAAGIGLDEAAVEAVSHYRFSPAQRDGIAVPVRMDVEVNFQTY